MSEEEAKPEGEDKPKEESKPEGEETKEEDKAE